MVQVKVRALPVPLMEHGAALRAASRMPGTCWPARGDLRVASCTTLVAPAGTTPVVTTPREPWRARAMRSFPAGPTGVTGATDVAAGGPGATAIFTVFDTCPVRSVMVTV
jgi:hypothetical protein